MNEDKLGGHCKSSLADIPAPLALRLYDILLDNMQSGFILYDRDTRILLCNSKASHILGLEKVGLIGSTFEVFAQQVFREDCTPLPLEQLPVNVVRRTGMPVQDTVLGIGDAAGKVRAWISVNAAPVLVDGEIDKIVVSFIDVTPIKCTLDALRRSESNLKSILDRTPLGVCVTDDKGFYEQVNDAYCKLYGYAREELLGKHFTLVVPLAYRADLSALHDAFIREGKEIRGEWDVVDKLGMSKTIMADAARIVMDDDRPRKVTFVMDITEKKLFEKQLRVKNLLLEAQTRMDPLTRLNNRKHLFEQLETLAEEFKRYASPFCVAMIDIDHFKKVNDIFGHRAGDDVLVQVAQEIEANSRETDIAARYGGEEFILVMPHTDLDGAVAATEKIREKVQALSLSDHDIRVTISAGVTSYRGQGVQECVEEADKALYRAKNSGRNRVVCAPE